MAEDLIETVAPLGPALIELRAQRADIRDHAQGAYVELVTPAHPGGVTPAERAALAFRVATLEGDAALAAHYQALLMRVGTTTEVAAAEVIGTGGAGAGGTRFALLMHYGDQVAMHPGQLDQAAIDTLSAEALSPQDIVAVTQLVSFVPYQVRVLAGLRAMQAPSQTAAPPSPPIHAAPARYTLAEVGWAPRIPPVDAASATPTQLAALEACPPAVRRSTYFLTLAQDPASLAERGALFNSVMYAPRGLPRAERELATATVSMVNGCVYCTSVHARRFAELSHEPATMQRILDDGLAVPLEPRRRAIVDFAAKLTATPGAVGAADLVPLREAGLAPLELLDLVHAIAMFANANRLMQSLGESTPPA